MRVMEAVTRTMADLSQHHAAGVRSFAFAEARDAAFAACSRELRFCLDAEGRLTHVEGPWQPLLGCEPGALLGAHWRVAVSPLDHAAMRVAVEHALSAREPVEIDLRMDADTIADSVVHWSLLAGAGADVITAVGYGRTVQDHALAAAQAEAARLRQQVRELESQVDVLDEHSRSMEGFAATAAHQLSEPLIVAESGTIMVAEDLGDALDPELRTRLDAIGRGAARARQMVDALLLDARSGSGLTLKPVDAGQIAAQVLEDLAPQMHERGAVAEVLRDNDRAALGDDQRLGELVSGGGRETLHRAAVLAQDVDLGLELADLLTQPRGFGLRGGEGLILLVADGRDEVRAGARQKRPVHDAVGGRVGVHAQIELDRLARRQHVLDRLAHRGMVEGADRDPPVRAEQRARHAADKRLPRAFDVGETAVGVKAEPQLARVGGEGRVTRLGEGEGADANSVVLGEIRHRPCNCFRNPHSHRSWRLEIPLGAIRSLSVRVFEPWPPAHPTVAGGRTRRK